MKPTFIAAKDSSDDMMGKIIIFAHPPVVDFVNIFVLPKMLWCKLAKFFHCPA